MSQSKQSQSHIYSILSSFLNFKNIKDNDDKEMDILFQLFFMDKNQLDKFCELSQIKPLEEALKESIFLKYDLSPLMFVRSKNNQKNDIHAFAIMITCIEWTFDDKAERISDDLSYLIECINSFNSIHVNPIRSDMNYCFSIIMNKALSLANQSKFSFDKSTYMLILIHLTQNDTFDSSYFFLLNDFLSYAINDKKNVPLLELQAYILQILREKRSIIHHLYMQSLVATLQPIFSSLLPQALEILQYLSKEYDCQCITDIFAVIPTSIYEHLISSPPFRTNILKKSDLIDPLTIPTNIFQKAMAENLSEFVSHSLNSLNLSFNFYSFISQRFESDPFLDPKNLKIIQKLAISIKLSSDNSIIRFMESFTALIFNFIYSPYFIDIAYIYICIFINSMNVNVLRSIISSFSNSFLFLPNITFFDIQKPSIKQTYEYLNSLRTISYRFLRDNFDENIFLIQILKIHKSSPLLLIEDLYRLNEIGMGPSFWKNDEILTTIITVSKSLIYLQQTPTILLAREYLVIFLFKLFHSKSVQTYCIQFPIFSISFLELVFDTFLSEEVINSFCNTLVLLPQSGLISPLIQYLISIFRSIISHCENENLEKKLRLQYWNLGLYFCYQLQNSLSVNPKLITDFLYLFDFSFKLLDIGLIIQAKEKLEKLLIITLHLIHHYYSVCPDFFNLSIENRAKLAKTIYMIEGEQPSKLVYQILISIASRESFYYGPSFILKTPEIIPLIINVFSKSYDLPHIFQEIYNICKYSTSNIHTLQIINFDYIISNLIIFNLIKHETESHDKYTCFSFELLKMDISIDVSHLFPLFSLFCNESINYNTVNLICKYLSKTDGLQMKYPFIKDLNLICYKCSKQHFLRRSIVGPKPVYQVNGISGNDLNNGFLINFLYKFDPSAISESHAQITLMKIQDIDRNILTITAFKNSLIATHSGNEIKTKVYIDRYIPNQSNYISYSVNFNLNAKPVKIFTCRDNEVLNDSDLCTFSFNPSELLITLGYVENYKSLSDEWKSKEVSALGSFSIYNCQLNKDELKYFQLDHNDFHNYCLFSFDLLNVPHMLTQGGQSFLNPDSIIEISQSSSIPNLKLEYNRPIENFKSNSPRSIPDFSLKTSGKNISFIISSDNLTRLNFLDQLVLGDNLNILCDIFANKTVSLDDEETLLNVLEIIKIAFMYSKSSEIHFKKTNQILHFLLHNPFLININIFSALFEILKIIKDEKLSQNWFESLIANLWLWQRSTFSNFFAILSLMKDSVIIQASSNFLEKSYFSWFLNDFIIFSSKCFGTQLGTFNSSPDVYRLIKQPDSEFLYLTNNEKSEYTSEQEEEIKNLMIQLIIRAGFMNLTDSDAICLFSHLHSSKQEELTQNLLVVLFELTPILKNMKGFSDSYINSLHYFLNSKLYPNVERVLLTMHELGHDHLLSHLLSASIQIFHFMKNTEIFNKLINLLYNYPNLYPLLSISSLSETPEKQHLFISSLPSISTLSNIQYPSLWYVWLIALLYKVNPLEQVYIADFLASYQNTSISDQIQTFMDVFLYIRYVAFLMNQDDNEILLFYLKSIYKKAIETDLFQNNKFRTTFILCCFQACFIHFSDGSLYNISDELFKMYMESPFVSDEIPSAIKRSENELDAKQIQIKSIFSLIKITNFDVSSLKLNFKFRPSQEILTLVIHASKNMPNVMLDVFNYFMKNSTSEDNLMNQAQPTLLQFFTDEMKKINESIFERITSINSELHSLLSNSESVALCSVQLENPCLLNQANQRKENEFKRLLNLDVENNKSTANNISNLSRDWTLTTMNVPKLIKVKNAPKLSFSSLVNGEILLEKTAYISKLTETPNITFILRNDGVQFLYTNSKSTRLFCYYDINQIFEREHLNNPGLEFFLNDGRNYYVIFNDSNEFSTCIKILNKYILPKQFISKNKISDIVHLLQSKWIAGKISNFDYIIKLNILSGRSFRTPMLYPIFPSLLAHPYKDLTYNSFERTKNKPIQLVLDRVIGLPTNPPQTPLEIQFTGSLFIPPELFYFSPFISPADNLPFWSSETYSTNLKDIKKENKRIWNVVYQHRKFLESKEVKSKINIWFDYVWGEGTKSGNVVLFHKIHPPFPLCETQLPAPQMLEFSNHSNHNILYASTIKHSSHSLTLSLIFSTGKINSYKIIFGIPNQNIPTKLQVWQHLNKFSSIDISDESYFTKINDYPNKLQKGKIFFSCCKRKIYCLSPTKKTIEVFWKKHRAESIVQSKEFFSQTSLFVPLSDSRILFCPTFSIVAIYQKDQYIRPILFSGELILQLAANHLYHIFAIATENYLSINSLRTGREIRKINFEENKISSVNQLLFTKTWSLLLVSTEDEILILSIEGEILKRNQIFHEHLFSISTIDGFDFVAFQDKKQTLWVFEVLYPEKQHMLCETTEVVKFIDYDSIHKAFVIILGDNHIKIAPYTLSC